MGETGRRLSISDALFLLSFLIIGSDRWSFSAGGFTVRLVNILLMLCFFLWLLEKRYVQSIKNALMTLPFLVAVILSGMRSLSASGTIAYVIWTAYNILITFFVGFTWGRGSTQTAILSVTRKVMHLIVGIILIQFVLGLAGITIPLLYTNFHFLPRPSVWFYEPSYLSTYLVTYLTVFLFMSARKGADPKDAKTAFVILIGMVFATSTTGFIGIALAFVVILVFSDLGPSRKLGVILIVALIIGALIGALYLSFPKLVTFYLGRIFTASLSESSGGRSSGWAQAWEIFKQNPLFGIGAGAYVQATGGTATNVTLELLATTGILGCAAFYAIPLSLLRMGRPSPVALAFTLGTFVFLATLQANQNFLRLYYWLHLGVTAGILAREESMARSTRMDGSTGCE